MVQCDVCSNQTGEGPLIEVAIAETEPEDGTRSVFEYLVHAECLPDEGGETDRRVYHRH